MTGKSVKINVNGFWFFVLWVVGVHNFHFVFKNAIRYRNKPTKINDQDRQVTRNKTLPKIIHKGNIWLISRTPASRLPMLFYCPHTSNSAAKLIWNQVHLIQKRKNLSIQFEHQFFVLTKIVVHFQSDNNITGKIWWDV